MQSISLNKVKDITDDGRSMRVVLEDGTSFPITFYFIHANELKFIAIG